MRQRASIGIALLALAHFAFANVTAALAQAGSTGGTIGKQDKSISGGNTPERSGAATRKKPQKIVAKKPAMAREHRARSPGGKCFSFNGKSYC